MLPDLERLIQLQDIESRAAVASRAIAEAPGRIAALDALLQSATASLAAAKQSLADNQTHRRSIDKDLISAQQRQEKYKEQLMAVKTNDEYRAMQHQIEAVGAEVLQHEERVLVSMMDADEINATIKKAEAALKAAQGKVAAERSAIETDVKGQQAAVGRMQGRARPDRRRAREQERHRYVPAHRQGARHRGGPRGRRTLHDLPGAFAAGGVRGGPQERFDRAMRQLQSDSVFCSAACLKGT